MSVIDADLLIHQSLDHLLLEDWIDDGGDEEMIESGDGCGDGTGNGCGDGNGSREIETVPDYILGIINSHSLDTSQRDKHQIVIDKTKINSGVIRYKPSQTLALQYIKTSISYIPNNAKQYVINTISQMQNIPALSSHELYMQQ